MDKQEVVKAIESFEEIISFLEGDGNLKHAEVLVAVAKAYVSASEELPKQKERIFNEVKHIGVDSYFIGDRDGFNECLDKATPIVARLNMENEELTNKYTSAISLMNKGNKLIDSLNQKIAELEKKLKEKEVIVQEDSSANYGGDDYAGQ